MEEILASIRRIIADDQPKGSEPKGEARAAEPKAEARPAPPPRPVAKAPPAPPPPLEVDEDDVLDLAELAPPGLDVELPELAFQEPEPEPVFEPEPPPVVAAPQPEPPPPEPPPAFEERLVSQATDSSVHHAFGALAHTVLTHNARTLDDIVREMLRPMLKAWLDDNLPSMVERLVRAEIERVARGR